MGRLERWHHERIKAEVRIRGSSLTQIARSLCITPSAVSATIRYRNRRSRRVEEAVAEVLGRTPAEIWPDRYPDNKTEGAPV